jgi:hypothetical protein
MTLLGLLQFVLQATSFLRYRVSEAGAAAVGLGLPDGDANQSERCALDDSDLADGYPPNNVLGGIPTNALDYSPTWDGQIYQWTPAAIANGYRGQFA